MKHYTKKEYRVKYIFDNMLYVDYKGAYSPKSAMSLTTEMYGRNHKTDEYYESFKILGFEEVVDMSNIIISNSPWPSNRVDANIIIKNEFYKKEDFDFYSKLFGNNRWTELPANKDMYDILVMLKLFKSKSQAKKNWKRSGKDIPKGFSHFRGIGKFNSEFCILNPNSVEK